jgi:hypothetical protein
VPVALVQRLILRRKKYHHLTASQLHPAFPDAVNRAFKYASIRLPGEANSTVLRTRSTLLP